MNPFHLLVPQVCRCCGRLLARGEDCVCLHCLADAPVCRIPPADLRAHRLPRTAPVADVLTWLVYRNSAPVPSLIRRGKYDNRPELIAALSRILARRVAPSLGAADMIVAIPMHWLKRLRRGFNQADIIAKELSRATGLPVARALRAVRSHDSQARHSGATRAANVRGMFGLRGDPAVITGRHIVLVDDILTTGATLSAAIEALLPAAPASITIVTLAATE